MSKASGSEPENADTNPKTKFSIKVDGDAPKKARKKSARRLKFLRKLAQKPKKPAEYTTDPEMTELGIPPFLQHCYLNGIPMPKITKLRDWQASLCRTESWKIGKSTFILVPTSGGKTVAADVAIAQLLEKNPKAKAIYTLPFVALANEKYQEYDKRFFMFQVRPFYQNIGGSDFRRGSIAICTFEKAHSLINSAILGGYADSIQLIIIDEAHMIGDEGRGNVIEALIIKARLMKHPPRIVALTATVNESDCIRLAKWIDGDPFVWKSRPTPIRQMVKKQDGHLCQITNNGEIKPFVQLKSSSDDKDHLMPLIRTLLSKKPDNSILVFVNTRNDTINIASLIASHMFDEKIPLPKVPQPSEEIATKRLKLIKELASSSGNIDEKTMICVKAGVLFHHGGLLLEDRKLIEEAAKTKVINVLVATTTLSAGVNISGVARVIIHNIYRTTRENKKVLIGAAQYTQMVGRAGRNGTPGEAYIIARSNSPNEMNDIITLSKNKLPTIVSHLGDGEYADRFFLQCLATKLLPPDGLRVFVSKFLAFDGEEKPEIDEVCAKIAERLHVNGLVDDKMKASKFGMAIAGSALSIEEALELNKIITQAKKNLCIEDEVHLLYLCVSPKIATAIKVFPYDCAQWTRIFKDHMHVIELITSMSTAQINHLPDLVHIYGGLGRVNKNVDSMMDRIMAAVILKELINETPLKDIVKEFQVDFGSVQKLQMDSAAYAGQINRFCELSGSVVLAAALNKFRQRLNFAARTDLLALMSIPSCSRDTARTLVEKGVMSPVDLSALTVEQCATLIVKEGEEITEDVTQLAEKLLKDAITFSESLSKIEELEDKAVLNVH